MAHRVASSAEQAASKDLQESNEKLCSAAEQGKLEEVDRLLKQGAKPDGFKNERGFTPLIAVCANGNTGTSDCDGVDHFECLDRLLEAGADVNQTTKVSFLFHSPVFRFRFPSLNRSFFPGVAYRQDSRL